MVTVYKSSLFDRNYRDGTRRWQSLSQELRDLLYSSMRFADRKRLSVVSEWFEMTVEDYERRYRTIPQLLGRFFSTVEIGDFQSMQGTTSLLISGSAALQFFSGARYDTDLDTYCVIDNCLEVGEWYISIGYRFLPASQQLATFHDDYALSLDLAVASGSDYNDMYHSDQIRRVWTFVRGASTIQLIASVHAPIQVILSFHSTCVMNFITHAAAYSLYPSLTFGDAATMAVDIKYPMTENQSRALTKYVERGYDVLTTVEARKACSPRSAFSFLVPRHVGDRYCWKIDIPYHGKSVRPDCIEINSWDIFYARTYNTFRSCQWPLIAYGNQTFVVSSAELRRLESGFTCASSLITRGILSENAALLLLQRLHRRTHPSRIISRDAWTTTSRVVQVMKDADCLVTCSVAHDLFGFFGSIVRHQIVFMDVHYLEGADKPVVVTLKANKDNMVVHAWNSMNEWGSSFGDDGIDFTWISST